MNAVEEIEIAIAKLPSEQLDELADWLAAFRLRSAPSAAVEGWLQRARGAALPGATTESVMSLTRGAD